MGSENQASFSGWAKVEILGHQSHTGFVTTEAYGQAVMFRIDRPEIAEAEETLSHTEWVGEQRCPAGTVVKRGKIEAVSVLVGSGSIYRIIPCTEEAALAAIKSGERRPLMVVRLPEGVQIAAPVEGEEDGDQDEDEEDDPAGERRARFLKHDFR